MNPSHSRFRGIAAHAVLLFGVAAVLPGQVGPTLLRVPEQSATELAARITPVRKAMDAAGPAVVHVMVKVNESFRLQRDSSGVTISADGIVLTNWHLVREVQIMNQQGAEFSLWVQTAAGKELPARLVAHDEATDLALLQVELGDGESLPFAALGDDAIPGEIAIAGSRPGDGLYANFIGSLSPSLSAVDVNGHKLAKEDVVLADANVKVLADGSPVFDIHGRVLAVVNTCNVRPPLHEKSTDEERRAYRTSFGFATRIGAARRVFAKQLASIPVAAQSAAATATRRKGLARAIEHAQPGIVSVRRASLVELPPPDPGDPHGKFPNDSLGSGVVVHPSGLVLTNAHLVGDEGVLVTTLTGETFPGEVLETSKAKNIALIKLRLPAGRKLPALKLADSGAGVLGEKVASLGNRYGHTVTAKVGVLSSRQRSEDIGSQHVRSMGHFQTDATIHNGNTGGALINIDGELLGVNDARAAIDEMDKKERHQALMALTDSTIGFALPANTVREELKQGLAAAGAAGAELLAVPAVDAATIERRTTPESRVVEKYADCFLNVFVKKVAMGAPKGGLMAELFPEPADDSNFRMLGQGSGVIIDPTGLALTNWHVVDAATYKDGAPRKDHKVFVSVRNGKKYEVEVLSTSRIDDLALLQMKLAPDEKMQAIRLGDSDAIQVGDTAIAVGNPHGFANSVTVGVVSAKNRDIRIKGRARYFRGLIQTDAAINPGNSGGALIDLNGYLIGINSAGHQREARQGFAIPVNYVRQKFHSTLLSSDKLRSVFLGMETETREGSVVVKTVGEFGPARDAGVQPGDVIREAQGAPVRDSVQLVRITRAAAPFSPFVLDVERGGETQRLTIEPVSDASWAVFRRAGFAVKEVGWGVAGEQLRAAAIAAFREYTGDPEGRPARFSETGLIVTHVRPSAAEAGMDIRKGDIVVGIRRKVSEIHLGDRYVLEHIASQRALRDLIRERATEKGAKLELWIARGDEIIKTQVTAKKVKS